MDRFPEGLLYILVFLGIVLFNFVQAMRRRQRPAEGQAPAEAGHEPPAAQDEPLEDIWGPRAAPAPAVAARPAPPPARAVRPAPRGMHPVRALLKDRRDLRQAVVLMMVLGPCRAQEPPEQR